MSNIIYGHVGYGILLLENLEDEGVPEALLKFGAEDGLWEDYFLRHLYPEGAPKELKISSHYLKGHDSRQGEGCYEVPVLAIEDYGYPNLSYDITSSRDNPADISSFLKALEERRGAWDELLTDFVSRCRQAGVTLAETTPHPFLYISWDSIGH